MRRERVEAVREGSDRCFSRLELSRRLPPFGGGGGYHQVSIVPKTPSARTIQSSGGLCVAAYL